MSRRRSSYAFFTVLAVIAAIALIAYFVGSALRMGSTPTSETYETSAGPLRSNGADIYFTGVDNQGMPIIYTEGTSWYKVHDGGCVQCHGPDGKGELPVALGQAPPPSIQWAALAAKQPPYAEAEVRRAITEGVGANGEALAKDMPRYQLSPQDLDDLIAFLKTLGSRPTRAPGNPPGKPGLPPPAEGRRGRASR
jgi:mono/diheme cytochrome c family protein